MKPVILVVDDEPSLRETMAAALHCELDCEVLQVESANEAVIILQSRQFDAVISDMYMVDDTGMDLLAAMQLMRATTPLIFFTATDVNLSPLPMGPLVAVVKKPNFDLVLTHIRRHAFRGE